MLRAVIDTNVLFEGLTHPSPCAEVIDAWVARRFQPCVSLALALEYQDVLSTKLSPLRGERALKVLPALLARCEPVSIYFSYRPASRDPGDDFVVDCVLNSRSLLVTENLRDFLPAAQRFGFPVLRPVHFLSLVKEESKL
jgi:predicted nucleic acid-binding protein